MILRDTQCPYYSPVFHEIVLKWVAGEDNPPLGPDGLERLRDGGVRVLDPVALVADDEVGAGVDQGPLDGCNERMAFKILERKSPNCLEHFHENDKVQN